MHGDRTGADRQRRRRRATSRLLASALAAAVSVVALAPSATPSTVVAASALATFDRQSPVVVVEASEALGRFRRYERRGTVTSLRRYKRARNQAARATAAALGLDAELMVRRWKAAGHRHQVAVLAALTQLGTQYRSFSASPSAGFDCSGLTSWAWRRAGVTIPRSSGDQIAAAAPRVRATARAGDIVHYPGHVSLYLGVAGGIVHASDPERDVELNFVSQTVSWGDPIG